MSDRLLFTLFFLVVGVFAIGGGITMAIVFTFWLAKLFAGAIVLVGIISIITGFSIASGKF